MKKTLATIGIATGIGIAGLGVGQVASAQTAEEPTTDTEVSDTEASDTEATEESEATDGRRGERDGDRDGRKGRKHRGKSFGVVAEILGVEADEIRAQLDEGLSLADIAEANDVDPDELVDAMVASVTERLDAKVAEGDLTEEEAAEKLAAKTERIEDKIYDLDDDADESDDDTDVPAESDTDEEPVEGEGS